MDNRITDKSVNITSTSRSTSAGKSPKTVYTMKCPISRTKVHSILLFSPFSAAAVLFFFFVSTKKLFLCFCFFFRFQVSYMVIHARSHTNQEFGNMTHTYNAAKMYKILRNGKSKNQKIFQGNFLMTYLGLMGYFEPSFSLRSIAYENTYVFICIFWHTFQSWEKISSNKTFLVKTFL